MAGKKIRITSRSSKKIRDTGAKESRVDPRLVEEALGAEPAGKIAAGGSPLSLRFLRQELEARLKSSGGRPGLEGTERRQKIPMSDIEWDKLNYLAQLLESRGIKTTPAQIASILLHRALAELHEDDLEREFKLKATG